MPIPPGQPLYFVKNPVPGLIGGPIPFPPEHRAKAIDFTRQVVSWAKQRGFPDVYFYGIDEASGETLRSERPYFKAIHAGG